MNKSSKISFLKLFSILLVTLLFSANSVYAELLTTYSINSSTIKNLDKWIDQDTLVLIEIDDVIVTPKSKMFRYNDNPYRLFIQNLISQSKQDSKYLQFVSNWYQARKLKLVEDGWGKFIADLQEKNIPVYGFCTMPIQLKGIERQRFLELQDLGISFTNKINNKDVLEIDKQEEWSSLFYGGIIFTGPFAKSKTLLDFIKITNISPKKILVFGQIKNDLKLIEQNLRGFRISYYNVLYLGARKVPGKPNPKTVQLQQKTLFEQGKWLEDEELE